MVLANAVPKWDCVDERGDDSNDTTSISIVSNVSEKGCVVDGHQCSSFKFDTYMTTIISEVLHTFSHKHRKKNLNLKMCYCLLKARFNKSIFSLSLIHN